MQNEYEIKPMTTKQGFEVIKLMKTDETVANMKMLEYSIYLDGKPIGKKLEDIPFRDTMGMIEEILEVNGMGAEGNE